MDEEQFSAELVVGVAVDLPEGDGLGEDRGCGEVLVSAAGVLSNGRVPGEAVVVQAPVEVLNDERPAVLIGDDIGSPEVSDVALELIVDFGDVELAAVIVGEPPAH